MEANLEFAHEIAQQAGDLLRDSYRQSTKEIRRKSDHSLVTEADLAADRLIAEAIQQRYPDDQLLTEETYTTLTNGRAPVWVIDPLDGTTNFSMGFQIWGVSIARVVDGAPSLAVLHFPLLRETYTARAGRGAYLNGEPLQVRGLNAEQPSAFFSCCTRTHRRYRVQVPYKTRILGSAVFSFCAVARGTAIQAFEAAPKIWDIVGGWLLVEESGGAVETFDGRSPFPLQPEVDYSQLDLPTLAAASDALLTQARQQIQLR